MGSWLSVSHPALTRQESYSAAWLWEAAQGFLGLGLPACWRIKGETALLCCPAGLLPIPECEVTQPPLSTVNPWGWHRKEAA